MHPELYGKTFREDGPIIQPDDPRLDQLCGILREMSPRWQSTADWPGEALALCGRAGVYRWFLPSGPWGDGWTPEQQTVAFLRLAEADLVTTFVITQYLGAIRRIAGSANATVSDAALEALVSGTQFATVGISHLTTSRQHLREPAMKVHRGDGQYQLDGVAPWVTGAVHADWLVVGGTLDEGEELLAAVPADLEGIRCGPGANLIALSASCTDKVTFESVAVDERYVLAGPCPNVMASGSGGTTGGLQTSTLAIGLARAAVKYLVAESGQRLELRAAAEQLRAEVDLLQEKLFRAASGDSDCDTGEIRAHANRLVMRCTQAAMTGAKGAGFIQGHPVGRWCCQALFFLVWSCPQPIANAHLCELAGIES